MPFDINMLYRDSAKRVLTTLLCDLSFCQAGGHVSVPHNGKRCTRVSSRQGRTMNTCQFESRMIYEHVYKLVLISISFNVHFTLQPVRGIRSNNTILSSPLPAAVKEGRAYRGLSLCATTLRLRLPPSPTQLQPNPSRLQYPRCPVHFTSSAVTGSQVRHVKEKCTCKTYRTLADNQINTCLTSGDFCNIVFSTYPHLPPPYRSQSSNPERNHKNKHIQQTDYSVSSL